MTPVPWDGAHDKIATAIAGRQTPDVSLIGTTWMGEFAGGGGLDPVPTDLLQPGAGVVTPHASFLALPYARRAALDNLAKLRRDFGVYGEGGFFDAVNVDNGQVSRHWLALDQGMVMAALGNELTGDRLKGYLTKGPVERAVRPLLAMEEFTAGG